MPPHLHHQQVPTAGPEPAREPVGEALQQRRVVEPARLVVARHLGGGPDVCKEWREAGGALSRGGHKEAPPHKIGREERSGESGEWRGKGRDAGSDEQRGASTRGARERRERQREAKRQNKDGRMEIGEKRERERVTERERERQRDQAPGSGLAQWTY